MCYYLSTYRGSAVWMCDHPTTCHYPWNLVAPSGCQRLETAPDCCATTSETPGRQDVDHAVEGSDDLKVVASVTSWQDITLSTLFGGDVGILVPLQPHTVAHTTSFRQRQYHHPQYILPDFQHHFASETCIYHHHGQPGPCIARHLRPTLPCNGDHPTPARLRTPSLGRLGLSCHILRPQDRQQRPADDPYRHRRRGPHLQHRPGVSDTGRRVRPPHSVSSLITYPCPHHYAYIET